MARITTVMATSHSPFLFQAPDWWTKTQLARGSLPGEPVDSDEQNAVKHARTVAAFEKMRTVFEAARPDVLIIFGDDQEEQFALTNFPAFAVYVGDDLEGYRTVAYDGVPGVPGTRTLKEKFPEHWVRVPAMPEFARAILLGLMNEGFDPAFMLGMPNVEHGMGHAIMRPTQRLTAGRFDVPVVPILVNCFYGPQPSGARCVAAARAIRRAIEAWPEDLNVAVLGSGGLWHTPGAPEAYLDSAFDAEILRYLKAGDADGMAAYFDAWEPPEERSHLACFKQFAVTGMPGGVGSGSGETRNWLMAAAVADRPGTVIDYIPVYASPCGMAFAHWEI
jgi:hypothetical protein